MQIKFYVKHIPKKEQISNSQFENWGKIFMKTTKKKLKFEIQ